MAIERLSSLAPARLPEFGTSTSWLMCRNALCPNFGASYDGPQPEGHVKSVSDARCRLDLAEGRAKCRHCHLSFQMLPNLSVRPLARHFLSLSLPFADCPDPECANHEFNLFENCPPKGATDGTLGIKPPTSAASPWARRCTSPSGRGAKNPS